MRPQVLGFSLFLAVATLAAAGCDDESGETPPAPTTAHVVVRVVAVEGGPIEGARVLLLDADTGAAVAPVAVTGADGVATFDVPPGAVRIRAEAAGYLPRPLPGGPEVPRAATLDATLEVEVALEARPGGAGARLEGTVTTAQGGLPGALVVAQRLGGTEGRPTVTDASGAFVLLHLPEAGYRLTALAAGYAGPAVDAAVPAEGPVAIELVAGGTGVVQGQVTFLAVQNGTVRVTLFDEVTGEAVPGLSAETEGGNYRIEDVPPGRYLAWAALGAEAPIAYVMDPDALRKFGLPLVEVAAGATVDQPFDVTGAVLVTAPDSPGGEPAAFDAPPTFAWEPYPSADSYVLEVADELGAVVWGGFAGTAPRVELPRTVTEVAFDADGQASALVPGRVYRLRVYAKKDDRQAPEGYVLVSMSEEQQGLFVVTR